MFEATPGCERAVLEAKKSLEMRGFKVKPYRIPGEFIYLTRFKYFFIQGHLWSMSGLFPIFFLTDLLGSKE